MKKYICFLVILFTIIFSFNNIYAQNILSSPTSTESQCVQWLKDKNAEKELIDLVPFIFKESVIANVDPTLVIAQTSLETNYFKSEVCKTYKNTAGIKSRYNSSIYAKYESYEEGLKAQIAHLALYSGNPQSWYYYKPWVDGIVTKIEELSGVWAEDENYSKKILQMMNEICSYESECVSITEVKPKHFNKTNKIYEILNRKNNYSPRGIDIINRILRK